MKHLLLLTTLLLLNISVSQNNNKTHYKTALDTITKTEHFIKYTKKSKFQVAKNVYPITSYWTLFENEIKKTNSNGYFDQSQQVKNLNELGDKKGKYLIYCTSIENDHFVIDVMNTKKKGKNLTYLFKIENDKAILQKTMFFK